MADLRAPEHHPYIFRRRESVDGHRHIGLRADEAPPAAMASARTAGRAFFGGGLLATGLPTDVDFGVSTALGFFGSARCATAN